MTTTTTRRHIILAGLAVAAAATPVAMSSVAAQSVEVPPATEHDPIFAVIEKHREANARAIAAFDRWNDYEENRARKMKPLPKVEVCEYQDGDVSRVDNPDGSFAVTWAPNGKWKRMYVHSVEHIVPNAPKKLSAKERSAWIDAKTAELEADARHIARTWRRSRLGKLEIARKRESDRERDVAWDLITTMPTTVHGLAAMLAYLRTCGGDITWEDSTWRVAVDHSIECATCALARLPEPTMPTLLAKLMADADVEQGAQS